jgi:hypothetical protein
MGGHNVVVTPFLHSRSSKYNPQRGGDLLDYLQMSFLRFLSTGTSAPTVQNSPRLGFEKADFLRGFFKQVGRNSMSDEQLEQPEEILADNFSLLVGGITDVPSPEFKHSRLYWIVRAQISRTT